jgi:hypothetical protein
MGTFIALTSNGEVNQVLAQRAVEEFKPPKVLAVFPKNTTASNNNNKTKVNQAFIDRLPIKTWNEYIDRGQIKLGTTILSESQLSGQQAHLQTLIQAGELLPLLVKRQNTLQVVKAQEDWQGGDEIIYLLHDPRPQLLKRLSGSNQSSRLSLEKLTRVEEIPMVTPIIEVPSIEPVVKEIPGT